MLRISLRRGGNSMSGFLIVILSLSLFLFACSDTDELKNSAPPAPVRIAVAQSGALARSLTTVGNVQGSSAVTITPRVDGQIVGVYFKEGEDVEEGQPLIKIDPRPYDAILAEKRANLAKSEAQLAKAVHDRSRFNKLVQKGFVSNEAYEQTATDAEVLRATVQADRAAVNRAALDLSYCSISAPISGRIGELKMHRGNMVKDNDTGPITTIYTISPCYVMFSAPESYLPAILEYSKSGPIEVSATPIGGSPEAGSMTLVDNAVDTKTGAIRLRATFENKDKKLWPGQFVEVKLPLGNVDNTLIVPARAIQAGADQSYVYVIDDKNEAVPRKIKVLFETDGKCAIAGDLKAGEKVVTEGQVRLAPGSPVKILD